MKPEVLARIKEAWITMSRSLENDGEELIDTSMLIAEGKINGRKVQVSMKFSAEEDDFMRSGKGVVRL